MLELALIENTHREDLNSIEIAISYQRLIEECSLTQEALSQKVSKKRSTVANYLRLLKLPAEVQLAIRDGSLSMGQARSFINIQSHVDQLTLLSEILTQGLNVREVEEKVREINKPGRKKVKRVKLPERVMEMARRIGDGYQTSVQVKRNTKGQGSIVLKFNSEEEMNRLLNLLDTQPSASEK
jgi:ParB family chromosome partitioning protein